MISCFIKPNSIALNHEHIRDLIENKIVVKKGAPHN